MFRARLLLAGLILASAARADTIILKDGSFVEGKVIRELQYTIHVSTRFGERTYRRENIEEIIESVDSLDSDTVNKFADLPAPIKAVLNAQAEYELKQYERARARLEPFHDHTESKAIRIRIDWLIIEINERLGQWEVARQLLEEKTESGTPQEKIRASAHLAIFDANPDYNLRYVGEKHARNFIKDEQVQQEARQLGALKDHQVMRIALEETCEQLLVEDRMSVKAFADKLDPEITYNACQKLPATGDVSKYLPYIDDLKHAEAALAKAQAILGDYGTAFELDLIRTELNHLLAVRDRLLDEVAQSSPENFNPSFESRTGRLTKDGRRQWRERCEDFLDKAKPVTRLLDYMLDRVDHYPQALRDLRKDLLETNERYKQMIKAVKKAKGRTHV